MTQSTGEHPDEQQRPERHTLFVMDLHRDGPFEVPRAMEVRGVRSNVELDLREASYATAEAVIELRLWFGRARLVVGPDVEVVVTGRGFVAPPPPPSAGTATATTAGGEESQLLLVSGYARFGGVVVERG